MKNLSVLLALLPIMLFSQNVVRDSLTNVPLKDGLIEYSGVVRVEGKSKNDIYIALKQWISDEHKSSKYVIDLDDKDAGIIIIKDNLFLANSINIKPYIYNVKSTQTTKIEIKDGRFRYTINNIDLSFYVNSMYLLQEMPLSNLQAEGFLLKNTTSKKHILMNIEVLKTLDRIMGINIQGLCNYIATKDSVKNNW